MAWNNQGGPWGGGKSPWGRGSGSGGGNRPPDFEEMLKRGQDRMRSILPGGIGSGRALLLILLGAVLLWLATGFFEVNPGEVGVKLVFGKFYGEVGPGLNWNVPYPVGETRKPNVTQQRQIDLGFRSTGPSPDDTRPEPEESLMLTGDEKIIDVQAVVFWRIRQDQLLSYLFGIDDPETSIRNAAESAFREIIGRTKFETAITNDRSQIESSAKGIAQRMLDSYNAGVVIEAVQLKTVDAPPEVVDAFKDVLRASADRVTANQQATLYARQRAQEAAGQVSMIRAQADGYKSQKVDIAQGDAAKFLSVYEQYRLNPDITRRRIYLETMEQVLGSMKKVLVEPSATGGNVVPYLPLDQLIGQTPPPAASPPPVQTVAPAQATGAGQ